MNYKFPWKPIKEYKEIVFHKFEGIARISINRPHVHNAFTPLTINEMIDAMYICREDKEVGVIIITGEGGECILQRRRSKCERPWRICRRRHNATAECS